MAVQKQTKLFKERLIFMGSDYSEKIIDGEYCIYKELPNDIDFEISGANNDKTKYLSMYVYIWCKYKYLTIIERIDEIKSMPELKDTMDRLTAKYIAYTHDDLESLPKVDKL